MHDSETSCKREQKQADEKTGAQDGKVAAGMAR